MDLTLLIVGGAAAAAAVALGRVGRAQRQALVDCERRTIASLAGLPQDAPVALRARLTCDQPVEDPLTRSPCACFRLAAYQAETTNNHRRNPTWLLLHETHEQAPDLRLQDPSGSIALDGEVELLAGTPGMSDPEAALSHFRVSGLDCQGEAAAIPPGAEVFVEARVSHREAETVLSGPIVVDARSRHYHRGTAWTLLALATGLMVLAVALVAGGLLKPMEPDVTTGPREARPLDRPSTP